jgi:Fur family transcriptional regulator, peroxide stress response regulator
MSMRQSRQRDVVLEAVRSTMDHPTADWVYRQARRRLPRIGLGTVYRNLKKLAADGVIREIHTGGNPARFDGNTGRHYHIRCLGCGRVNDLPMSIDTRLEDEAGRAMNYRILGHQVEVFGLCPSCQARPEQDENHSHDGEGSSTGVGEPRHPKEGSKQ